MARRKPQPSKESTQRTRRSTRRTAAIDHGIPDVYGDMVAEAVAEEQSQPVAVRSAKRRKISEEPAGDIQLDFDLFGPSYPIATSTHGLVAQDETTPKLQQIVYDDFEVSDESDVEFEDVELEPGAAEEDADEKPEQKTLQLDLSNANLDNPRRGIQRRKPVGPAERRQRLEVHKAHLICLLAHLSCRNRWCESESVHVILKPLVPRKVISLLHVDESKPQYQRSHSFMKGIEEVCLLWRTSWTISARGMRRAQWKDEVDALKESDDSEDLIDFDDFKSAAKSHTGSRDLGAQLFCALLRAVAVDARLVCSLQVLPFSGVAKGQTPEKPKPQYYHAPSQNYNTSPIVRPERPVGPSRKRIVDSPFPIFWVEVFSPATSTWIPLDPLVRNTINKPKTGFEPHASDRLNSMSYVIAFEDDGSAKDVTRRYTQWFNAKTRKQRIGSTKGGDQWWRRTTAVFQKPFTELRDEIEEADLIRRAESEAMPRNVQDFKGHPIYVLERHLRMNEVIHPLHEVGKVSTGVSKNAKLESVFRRRDVHFCRTADAWYRRGRDVNQGEQPLKRVVPKRKRDAAVQLATDFEDEGEEDEEGMALYAEYQTSFYKPPPVVDGQIPKNAYGNLDVYVPSMIPAGAVHIRHPLAGQAAKVLGIDYVEAVTGFEFKGRQGTAVIDGVVVSMNMCNGVVNVIEGLESQASEEAEAQRSRIILGMWKRWLTALRVREKVHREYGDKEEAEGSNNMDEDEAYHENGDFGGGFVPEASEEAGAAIEQDSQPSFPSLKPLEQLLPPEAVHREIIVVRSPNTLPEAPESKNILPRTTSAASLAEEGGGFLQEDELIHKPGPTQASHIVSGGDEIQIDSVQESGGFLPEDEDTAIAEGGFLPDAPDTTAEQHRIKDNAATDNAMGGGFIPESETDKTREMNPAVVLDSSGGKPQHNAVPLFDGAHDNADGSVSPASLYAHGALLAESPSNSPRAQSQTQPAAEESNRSPRSSLNSETSLLSHDPDEEDAEPEWLLNSLGEMD